MGNIAVGCQNCGQVLSIPAQYAGQTGRCNKCGASVAVPPMPPVVARPPEPVFEDVKPPQAGTNPVLKAVMYGFGGCLGIFAATVVVGGCLAILSPAGQRGFNEGWNRAAGTNSDSITLDEFNRIQTGMTMSEVAGIVGSWGTVDSENTFGAGTQFATATAMYSFHGAQPLSRAGVMVQNGRVVQKHQFGLR